MRSLGAARREDQLENRNVVHTVDVVAEAGDLVEVDPATHTDLDRALFDKLPLESQSSSLSSLVTLASPGNLRRFERHVSRVRRSRLEFVFASTASRSRTSRAKFSRIRFRWTRCSRSK